MFSDYLLKSKVSLYILQIATKSFFLAKYWLFGRRKEPKLARFHQCPPGERWCRFTCGSIERAPSRTLQD
jgi:hypothetical protein